MAVTTSATKIVSADPNRVCLKIQNVGNTTMYVGPDSTVGANQGIALQQLTNAGSLLILNLNKGDFEVSGDLWCISPGTPSNVFVLEDIWRPPTE